ncbi:conserved membrane hypothetical protein [Tenacibaculum sediminilitoris]|uniref:hypothetical protein n=1 Tax=Tenacibaculum sediminilitoris TaxID=1820334 RepID=UPI0038952A49
MVADCKESNALLLRKIKAKIGDPVSVDVVVAILESIGIKSENVPEDFGFPDSRALASDLFQKLTTTQETSIKKTKKVYEVTSIEKTKKVFSDAYLFIKQYVYGTSYLLAFALQLTSIILYGFSIYVYTGFNQLQSTIVVLGIIIGMVISGGFIQVIGNQISKHFYLKDFLLVEKMTYSLLKKGGISIFCFLLGLVLLNLIIPLYPFKTMLLIACYAFWVGLLFLVFAPLHVINRKKVIFLATFNASIVCLPFINNTSVNIYLLHFIGLFVAVSTVLIFLIVYFRKKRATGVSSNVSFQKGAVIYNNLYAFFYGVFLNFFFFIDRIIAWSSNETSNFFLPIYYEKNYEIGMDLSIIFLLLLAGILEYSNTSLFNFLNFEKYNTCILDMTVYRKKTLSLYLKSLILMLLSSIPIYSIVLYIFYGKWGYNYFFSEPLTSTSIKIANIGILGYFFLCWGILNSSYLISLKKQKEVLKIILFACLVNIVSGFIISRLFSYSDSSYGMLLGSVVFTYFTLKENIHVYKNIDYYATI